MNRSKTIRKFFIQNYKVKILSLLCSLFLWFYVTLGNQYEHVFPKKIEAVNIPEGKILIKNLPDTVPVRYRGIGSAFLRPDFNKQHILIDLSQYPEDTEIAVSLEMIQGADQLKNNIIPIRIEQDQPIEIAYDDLIYRKVPIVSQLNFKPKTGYTQVGDVVMTPDSIVLKGPAKEIDHIRALYTESKVMQVFRPIHGTVALIDSTTSLVEFSRESVDFYADIQGIGERMIYEIPVQIINSPSYINVTAVPSTLSLRLQGGVEILKKISDGDVVATIDYRRRRNYGRRIPAMIHVPPNVTFTDVKPRDFELLVER